MKLSPQKFNTWLNNIGQRFAWRRSYACPCVSPHSGAAQPGCQHCGGKGRIWDAPVEGISGIAGQKVQTSWAQFGVFEPGDVVLTLPSDSALYDMGRFDRVVMLDSTQPFSTLLTRGSGTTERLLEPIKVIDRVFWIDDSKQIVDGGVPTITADGEPQWSSGEPPQNKTYTITGRQHPEYFVWGEFPQDRAHHGGADLPRRVVLRKFDLFGR